MPTLRVDTLTFNFNATVAAGRYDQWQHYARVWNAAGRQQRAVDVVAVDGFAPPTTAWLIEGKDFRVITNPPKPSNIGGLAQYVADKATHTLAGLSDAQHNATVPAERHLAARAMTSTRCRVVLHLEPHTGPHTVLFPTGFPASVLQQLRILVRGIDANPLVLNITNTPHAGVPWTVT